METLDLEVRANQPAIFFQADYVPSGFDRPVTEDFKNGITRHLKLAGITTLLVIIKRDAQRRVSLDFEGAYQDIAIAKVALAGYCAWS